MDRSSEWCSVATAKAKQGDEAVGEGLETQEGSRAGELAAAVGQAGTQAVLGRGGFTSPLGLWPGASKTMPGPTG